MCTTNYHDSLLEEIFGVLSCLKTCQETIDHARKTVYEHEQHIAKFTRKFEGLMAQMKGYYTSEYDAFCSNMTDFDVTVDVSDFEIIE